MSIPAVGEGTQTTQTRRRGGMRVPVIDVLHGSEEDFRAVADCMPAMLWIVNAQGECTFCNQSWLRFTGRLLEEELGQGWMSGIHPEDLPGVKQHFQECIALLKPFTHEYRYRNASGEYRWLLDNGVPRFGPDGQFAGFVGYAIDINDRKELEQQVLKAQKMEAVGQLASGVAHNFNNLLTIVKGYSELLLAEHPDQESKCYRYLQEIREASGRAAALTQQLLAFSRKPALTPTVVDVNRLVASADKLLRRSIREDVEIFTRLSPDVGRIRADAAQLEQVLLNLAVNARDAMPKGGRLTLETAQVDLPQGPHVALTVADTGCGMSEEVRAHLFEPFFTTKPIGEGTGLGLAFVYGIVQQLGGRIQVASEPGQGTTIQILLPIVTEEPAVPKEPRRGTETILLVEDDDGVRQLTRTVLEAAGYTVLAASEGNMALERSRQHPGPIHLLLTDVVMPLLSGPELARSLTAARADMRVLFVSGYSDSALSRQGFADGAVLRKPFTPEHLVWKVRAALDGKDAGGAAGQVTPC